MNNQQTVDAVRATINEVLFSFKNIDTYQKKTFLIIIAQSHRRTIYALQFPWPVY